MKKTKKQICREVCFYTYVDEKRTHEGRFLITKNKEVSCFGHYVELGDGNDRPAIYEGLHIEHELTEDRSGSVTIRFFKAVESDENVLGYKQLNYCNAALNIGEMSALDEFESIMLGEEIEFVFKTHTYS